MKVAVLGAGVVGVTSAYYLAKAGHSVTVIDRRPGPALETSFANAGEVSFGYCSPWAAPGIPMKAVRWLLMKHAPLILRPNLDAAMLVWMAQMLRNCTSTRYALNKSRMLRLADPRALRSAFHERRSGARGRFLWTPVGKPASLAFVLSDRDGADVNRYAKWTRIGITRDPFRGAFGMTARRADVVRVNLGRSRGGGTIAWSSVRSSSQIATNASAVALSCRFSGRASSQAAY